VSAGVVVLIIIVILLVVFLGIDLVCYMMRECGNINTFLMTIMNCNAGLLWCLSSSFCPRRTTKGGGGGNRSVAVDMTNEEARISKPNIRTGMEHMDTERTPMM
jgi:hypothetical protein